MSIVKDVLERMTEVGETAVLLSPLNNLTGVRHVNYYNNSGKKMNMVLRNVYTLTEMKRISDLLGGEIKNGVLEVEMDYVKVKIYKR